VSFTPVPPAASPLSSTAHQFSETHRRLSQDKDKRYFVVGNAHYADSLNSIIDHFKTHPINDEGKPPHRSRTFARGGQCDLMPFFSIR
jgi:hypothetical protein